MNFSKNNKVLLFAYVLGYRVDSAGKVFSPTGKQLKLKTSTKKTSTQYYEFNIRYEKKSVPVKVHRLQAYQKFKNLMFEIGIVVRHKNNNSFDNSIDNIILGTESENQMDRPYNERLDAAIHASQFMRVWDDSQLQEIFDDKYKKRFSYRELGEKYGIAKSTLSFLFNKSIFAKNYVLTSESYSTQS